MIIEETVFYKLINDHFSAGKEHTKYGSKGDLVKIIYEEGHVCIVENAEGNKFPIRNNLIEKV